MDVTTIVVLSVIGAYFLVGLILYCVFVCWFKVGNDASGMRANCLIWCFLGGGLELLYLLYNTYC
jgi:hypothetical protein